MAQYSLTLVKVVIPGGHEVCGRQNVSKLEAPSKRVMLYHLSGAQEQETAIKIINILQSKS